MMRDRTIAAEFVGAEQMRPARRRIAVGEILDGDVVGR